MPLPLHARIPIPSSDVETRPQTSGSETSGQDRPVRQGPVRLQLERGPTQRSSGRSKSQGTKVSSKDTAGPSRRRGHSREGDRGRTARQTTRSAGSRFKPPSPTFVRPTEAPATAPTPVATLRTRHRPSTTTTNRGDPHLGPSLADGHVVRVVGNPTSDGALAVLATRSQVLLSLVFLLRLRSNWAARTTPDASGTT